jgi:hypothetical protein
MITGVIAYAASLEVHLPFLRLIVTSMTLFVGFSMNVVVLMLRYAESSDASSRLITQVRNIAVYLVSLGIIIVLLAFIGMVISENLADRTNTILTGVAIAVGPAASAAYYALIAHFFMIALLFPARVFTIIENIGGGGNNEADQSDEAQDSAPRDVNPSYSSH